MDKANRCPSTPGLLFSVSLSIGAFGLTPFFKKLAITDSVTPWTVALGTTLAAAVASAVTLLVTEPRAAYAIVRPRFILPIAAIGIVAGALVTLLVVHALSVTTATNHSLFQAAYPAATLVFAHLILGERLTGRQYLSIALVMFGLLLMNGVNGDARFGLGFWLLLATLPLIGLSDVYAKRLTEHVSPLTVAGGRHLYGAVCLLCVIPFLDLVRVPGGLSLLWILLAGLLQGVGVWALYRALQTNKASLVGGMVASAPLITFTMESMFLDLRLSATQGVGLTTAMLAAAWLAYSATAGKRK